LRFPAKVTIAPPDVITIGSDSFDIPLKFERENTKIGNEIKSTI
jgi:hypothetical protein